MPWFDETRLDDEGALAGIDPRLRALAESGARLRRAAVETDEDAEVALARDLGSPRTVVLLGPEAGLVRLLLAPHCPVPMVVAEPEAGLPGWVGGLDLVVVLAPAGAPDAGTVGPVAAAVRRGCQVLAVCAPDSPVADHAAGRWSAVLTSTAAEPVVVAVLAAAHLGRLGLGPAVEVDAVADAMDEVAVACSPHRATSTNPAKRAAGGLGDTLPLVGTRDPAPLALRAVREAAAALRRLTGLPVVGGDADALLPVLEATAVRSVFDDPYDDPAGATPRPRPSLLLLADEGGPVTGAPDRLDLAAVAEAHGVRVVGQEGPPVTDLAAYAAHVLRTTYTATYLRLGTVD